MQCHTSGHNQRGAVFQGYSWRIDAHHCLILADSRCLLCLRLARFERETHAVGCAEFVAEEPEEQLLIGLAAVLMGDPQE